MSRVHRESRDPNAAPVEQFVAHGMSAKQAANLQARGEGSLHLQKVVAGAFRVDHGRAARKLIHSPLGKQT